MAKTIRRGVIIALGMLMLALGCAQQQTGIPEVKLHNDLDKAKADSLKENKPLIVYFYQVESDACREFEDEVLVRNSVREASQKVIWVQVNGALYPEVAHEFAVFALPTIILMNPGGTKELDRIVDVPTPEELISRMDLAEKGISRSQQILDAEIAHPDDLAAAYAAAMVWRDRGRIADEAVPLFRYVYEHDLDNSKGFGSKALFQLAFADILTRNHALYPQGIQKLELLAKNYPQSSEAPKALLVVGDVLLALGKRDEALAAYQRVIDTYPDSQSAKDAEEHKLKVTMFEDTVRAFNE
jgi:tetratricopeptide (TPR) repeat protein